jgi:NAD(P)H-hydrate epimerase
MAGKTAVALGPGIGIGPELTSFVKNIIRECEVPLVIDADGINAVSDDVSMLDQKGGPVVLTPHPGEMARLNGTDARSVLADRFGAALGFAKERGVIVVLKGAYTLTAVPDGRCFVNLTGNPGMASGGTGDVLTGMILGFMCQGLAAEDAAVLGVYLHGLAGDTAAERLGEEALIAGDLMARIPDAIKSLREAGGK